MDAGKGKVGSTNGLFKPSGHAASAREIPLFCMYRRANLAPTVTDYE
jgi:hypothetical protein